jgi:hypothetical protein
VPPVVCTAICVGSVGGPKGTAVAGEPLPRGAATCPEVLERSVCAVLGVLPFVSVVAIA